MNARLITAGTAVLFLALLSGCSAPSSSVATNAPPSADASTAPEESKTPSSPPVEKPAAIPTDCESMLWPSVREQLEGHMLNDPNMGTFGVGEDGSLSCLWRHPGADTTYLETKISELDADPAETMLDGLAIDDGFACTTTASSTRCKKTWANTEYPVTDGRTVHWQQGILIDTRYSNLAVKGFTDSIVEYIFG